MTGRSSGACMANINRQQLLIDTDAYCKLGVAGLLTDAIALLGVQLEDCGRLAALPYMLQRGRLREKFGADVCDSLKHLAKDIPIAIQPSNCWLDPLSAVTSIDPGEAQLLAASAEHGQMLVTGDKRGLYGVKDILGYSEALDGRVVVLEAILSELCVSLGVNEIRSRIRPLMEVDVAVRLCFSDENVSPSVGLLSYFQDLAVGLRPLKLWRPSSSEGK